MGTSRTGTSRWKTLRLNTLRVAQQQGLTHCPDCQTQLDYQVGRKPNSAEVDHIIPHANGGRDEPGNLRVCCRLCNQRRGNRPSTPKPATTTTTLVRW